MTIKPIETRYAGCRFRSRTEARWAVFFDAAAIPWEYEPQGFVIDGKPYLPDFHLPECGTWIEVKGATVSRDVLAFLDAAAEQFPRTHRPGCEEGPALMILGPIPDLPKATRWSDRPDLGWWTSEGHAYGFGSYAKNRRPWYLPNARPMSPPEAEPDIYESMPLEIASAYRAARAARFEHGEQPAAPISKTLRQSPPRLNVAQRTALHEDWRRAIARAEARLGGISADGLTGNDVLIRLPATRFDEFVAIELRRILASHPGTTRVLLQIDDRLLGHDACLLSLDDRLRVTNTAPLRQELRCLLGPKCFEDVP